MIKRFKNWLYELTLTQQLFTIIILSVSFFLAFVIFSLNYNIEAFIKAQMFQLLDSTQSVIVRNYTSENVDDTLALSNDSFVGHSIYRLKEDELATSPYFFSEDEELIARVKEYASKQEARSDFYDISINKSSYLLEITKLDADVYLISMINNTYRESFKNALVDQIINITFIVVSIIFFLLLLWVAYLIRSLNQLTAYTQKVRRGEEATLETGRKDEIGDLANSLVEMNEELQRQQKVKEELIQNISHDLKTPIATIKSYAESIKDGIYPYDSLEKSVDVIIEHSERLEKKVQNLLLLNRVGYLVANDETGSVDLKDVIDKVLLSLRVIRPEIEIVTETTSSIFFGDEEPWRVVIENLLDNALRYAKSTITLRLTENDFSIENDGPFMSEDRIEKLFKPYEKGTDGKFGLGLSIVYKIVTVYNCEVYAYNSRNGVVFKIVKDKNKENEKKRRNKKNR